MGDEVENLVNIILMASMDHSAEELAAALHRVVLSTGEVCDAFNRQVDAHLNERLKASGLKRTPLQRLMTKNKFVN